MGKSILDSMFSPCIAPRWGGVFYSMRCIPFVPFSSLRRFDRAGWCTQQVVRHAVCSLQLYRQKTETHRVPGDRVWKAELVHALLWATAFMIICCTKSRGAQLRRMGRGQLFPVRPYGIACFSALCPARASSCVDVVLMYKGKGSYLVGLHHHQ